MTTSSNATYHQDLGSPVTENKARANSATRARMKAVVVTGYGATDVLELTDLKQPTPGDNEVLIKVYATNVTAADSMMRRGDPAFARLFLGLMKPKNPVPGTGLAGVVEAVGDAVTRFKVGDAVFGEAGLGFGAHAEYVCVPEDGVIIEKPETMSHEDAAAMCDGPMTSLNFLKRMAKTRARSESPESTALLAAWAPLPSSWPNSSGQRSRACAVRRTSNW